MGTETITEGKVEEKRNTEYRPLEVPEVVLNVPATDFPEITDFLKRMRLKNSMFGFQKEDVYAKMQQLNSLYETRIQQLREQTRGQLKQIKKQQQEDLEERNRKAQEEYRSELEEANRRELEKYKQELEEANKREQEQYRRELEEKDREAAERHRRELAMVREEMDRLIERLTQLRNKMYSVSEED